MKKIDDDTIKHMEMVVAHFWNEERKHFELMSESGEDTKSHVWLSLNALKGFLEDVEANDEIKVVAFPKVTE
jgi:hypothetical protein